MKSSVIVLLVVTLAHISFAKPPGPKLDEEGGNGKSEHDWDLLVELNDGIKEILCILYSWEDEHVEAQGHNAESDGNDEAEQNKPKPGAEQTDQNPQGDASKRALTSVLRQLSYALGTRGVDPSNADGVNGGTGKQHRRCGGNNGNKSVNNGQKEGKQGTQGNSGAQDGTAKQEQTGNEDADKRSKLARLEDLRRALANLEF